MVDLRENEVKDAVFEKIDFLAREAFELNYFLAENPELSGKEYLACEKICALLESHGITVERAFAGIPTAFRGTVCEAPDSGINIGIIAEYDALPEIGHACGHNLHGSMSVLTALSLLPILKDIDCELLVAGTPAEETDGAKVEMSAKGLFDGCDFAMMIHSCGGKNMVEYRSLAMDAVEFTFTGKTSHAASAPWEGRNALNGLQLFFHAVDMLRQHVRPEARMHGIVYDGGAVPNIVPERAVGRFYFRAPKRAYLDEIIKKVHNCARGAALARAADRV